MDQELLEMARVEVGERLDRMEGSLLELDVGSSAQPETIDSLFRDAHTIKGTAAILGWEQLSALSHAAEDRLSSCRDEGELPEILVDPLLRAVDAMRKTLAGEELDPTDVASGLSSPPPPPADEPAATARAVEPGGSIRVQADKVDRMLDAVGEAVLHHRRLDHQLSELPGGVEDEQLEEELSQGERLLGDLQDAVIEMRTLPLSTITAPFIRAVRDLAVANGKRVELRIEGADTQLDRLILDGISGPITHVLRNAVAHGIETLEQRELAGKPAAGQILLRASQRERMVAIEVTDDGRGVAASLVAQAEGSASLADVLSTAGLSTAARVTELSGRGVGMDAVRSYVEGLGGHVEVSSQPSVGTTVTMLLPLTLALLEVLLCERGGHPFGIPLSAVREVVVAEQASMLQGRRSIEVRGEAVRLADLAELLGAAGPELPERPRAVVLGSAGRAIAVACDGLLGNQEVVMKGLGPLLSATPGYLGAAILGDGRVGLILDPNHLLELPARRSAAARPAREAEIRKPPRLLVVDDQFTVRELQRSILETAGYSVETAPNGRDALERVGSEPSIDLVLTDIQMPEMDGFELVRALRTDPDHASLPIVVVSSRSSESDRLRGLEEGADAYIAKQEFDQQSLLETVGRLVGG
ncbi:MAG TPA: response regulator [Solirubrobacteraceae bacterium]|nr:response regulator [Solirubrobacteraceae bacterium]